jgi:glycosyltransferase involved in cell wall biosynthesis
MSYRVGGVIVGTGPEAYVSSLQKLAVQLSVDKLIVFAGLQERPEDYLAAADLVLFPTLHEALPNLLVESYMLGRPVVMSAIAPMADLVKDKEDSLVVREHDPILYARAVRELLTDKALYERIAESARVTYARSYDPFVVAEKYAQIYMSLLRP